MYLTNYKSEASTSEEICEFDIDNNKIEIIHITDNPFIFKNTDYIRYTNTNKIDEKLFDNCKKSNIYIYIDIKNTNDEKKKIIKEFVELLSKNENKIYKNINIVNIVKNFQFFYMIPFFQNFRKIINIKGDSSNTRTRTTGSKYETYQKYEESEDSNKDDNIWYNYKISIIEETNSNMLIDQTFYKAIMSIPICASGRLTQSTGTCWMNAIINSIILVPYLRKKIIEFIKNDKYYEILKDLGYMDIKGASNVKYALFILFNNLLLKQNRAQPNNGNFIADIAARFKSIFETNYEKHYRNLRKENYNKVLEYGVGSFHFVINQVVKFILTIFCKMNSLYCNLGDKSIKGFDKIKKTDDVILLNLKEKIKIDNVIIINDIKYVIQSAFLNVYYNRHAIAGLVCNDVSYIYDSNNHLTFDNWITYDSENYKKVIHQNTVSEKMWVAANHIIESMSYVIYIKETLVKNLKI